jgi:hypothetical protein
MQQARGGATETESAGTWLPSQLITSESFQLIAIVTEFSTTDCPVRTARCCTSDGTAGGLMKDQMCRSVPGDVDHEAIAVGFEPIKVTQVIINKPLHVAMVTVGRCVVMVRL